MKTKEMNVLQNTTVWNVGNLVTEPLYVRQLLPFYKTVEKTASNHFLFFTGQNR